MAKVKIQFPGMIIPHLGIISVLPKEAKVPVPRRGKAHCAVPAVHFLLLFSYSLLSTCVTVTKHILINSKCVSLFFQDSREHIHNDTLTVTTGAGAVQRVDIDIDIDIDIEYLY